MSLIRPAALRRLVLSLLIPLACLASLPTPARAQTSTGMEQFTVRDVVMDVTAANALAAREQALADAQTQAFRRLIERLAAESDAAKVATPTPRELQDFYVLDVGIDREQTSANRWIGSVSVRFRPDAIRKLLRNQGIKHADWRGRPLMVVPALGPKDGAVLWDDPNPWKAAWAARTGSGLIPTMVPAGNADDLQLLAAPQAVALDTEALRGLAQKYNTPDALIAWAQTARPEGGRVTLDLSLRGIGPVAEGFSGTRSFTGEEGETPELLMRRVVNETMRGLEEAYKKGNLLNFDRAAALSATVPFSGLPEWLSVRERLVRVTPIRAWELVALSKKEAAVILHYVGDQDQLTQVLAQNGLALAWADDHWVITRR